MAAPDCVYSVGALVLGFGVPRGGRRVVVGRKLSSSSSCNVGATEGGIEFDDSKMPSGALLIEGVLVGDVIIS